MGVDTKLYNYPGNGHALLQPVEHNFDANMNISLWMDKYLMEPYVDDTINLTEVDRVLQRVKERLGPDSLLLLYYCISQC